MSEASPFHRGESEVQERLGVREQIEPWARKVVRSFLPEEHRQFYAGLPYLVIAARDDEGRPWASLLAGEPGFVSSPDPRSLRIGALPDRGDPLHRALQRGSDVGVLGIELHTRRRNRVNGSVCERSADALTLRVGQAFGNCPQYISPRTWRRAEAFSGASSRCELRELDESLRAAIESADTFFIATGQRGAGESEAFGMDASHRGGAPGFVRVVGERTLLFPDYAGNNHFNTLGNLQLDPRAGLLFADFESGDTFQLSGRAFVEWDHPELASFPGAQRLVRFELERAVVLRGALPLRFDVDSESVRELRLIAKIRESEDVVSFVFEARDGAALSRFAAGQHLPIEVDVEGHEAPLLRTYSLSSGPDDAAYRISVKREPQGAVSRHLHDFVEEGDILRVRPPSGDFRLEHEGSRPIVLLSAGVGLTPMLSMLRDLSHNSQRPVFFVHGARDGAHHPLAKEVELLAQRLDGIAVHVAYSRPRVQDVPGRGFQSTGRLDATVVEKLVPGFDADYYLCGPRAFMAEIQSQLEARGVAPEQIRSESFGPAGG